MSTRVIFRNRVLWATPDAWQRRRVAEAQDPDKIMPVVDSAPKPRAVGAPWYDQTDDLWYRVVDRLDPALGWCIASHLCDHYGVSYRCLLDWARRGYLDPAIELNSPTKRYQVRDPATVAKLAKAWIEKQPVARAPLAEVRARQRKSK